jgi:hypothetical protein
LSPFRAQPFEDVDELGHCIEFGRHFHASLLVVNSFNKTVPTAAITIKKKLIRVALI